MTNDVRLMITELLMPCLASTLRPTVAGYVMHMIGVPLLCVGAFNQVPFDGFNVC